ncbi:MAG: hypothetical protein H0U57_06510 [Tatlockia sp.]|nr:hypothetical protein [Tatlockia sp.]
MSFFKTIADSIGTASGVACPLFGIITASLSLQIGGTIAVVLGSLSIGLFGFVAVGMFYFIYKKNQKEELELAQKTSSYLTEFIENYCQIVRMNNMNDSNVFSFLKRRSQQKEEYKFQLKFIEFIKVNYPDFLKNYPYSEHNFNNSTINEIIEEFNASESLKKLIKPPTWISLASSFFISLAGVFGAIAGTSAGIMGILIGLGITTGFAACPPIGIAILVLATLTALFVAIQSIQSTVEKNQKTQVYKSFKHFNNAYENGLNLDFSKTNDYQANFNTVRPKTNFALASANLELDSDELDIYQNQFYKL